MNFYPDSYYNTQDYKNRLMFKEENMGVNDGVSPIDSINKYFFLDWKGIDRYHQRLMNYFLHSNLKDLDPVTFTREQVYNKEPAFYKQTFDEFGHTVKIQEIKPCIDVLSNPSWEWILLEEGEKFPGQNNYALPSTLTTTQYTNLTTAGLLSTNVTYIIKKPTETNQVTTLNDKICYNAKNSYHEFLLTSLEYDKTDGLYHLTWEMFGGDEGGSGGGSGDWSSTVIVTTLNPGSSATASVNNIAPSGDPPLYQLSLGIPRGANGTNGNDGREVEIKLDNNFVPSGESSAVPSIVWRYANQNPADSWKQIVALSDIRGLQGPQGNPGTNGTSVTFLSESITGGTRVTLTDGSHSSSFDVLNGTDGQNGTDGTNGRTPELQMGTGVKAHTIQKKYTDEQNWIDLIDLDSVFTIDSTLNINSHNAIENAAVASAIGDIQTILATLTTPSSP